MGNAKRMKREKLYSIIWEFREGSFVSQVWANFPQQAFLKWIEIQKENGESASFTKQECFLLNTLINYDIDSPVLLNGMQNVWGTYFSINENDYINMTIVETVALEWKNTK